MRGKTIPKIGLAARRAGVGAARRLARRAALLALVLTLLAGGSCLPQSPVGTQRGGQRGVTLYAFSVMKEALEKAVIPGFVAKWKQEHGADVRFTSSFAGSETITNQILQGVAAEVGIFSIERDVERLAQGGVVTGNWQALPHKGVVNKTPFIILVRKGNPKGIRDFEDLAKRGVALIHPDPVSSGGAMWSLLAQGRVGAARARARHRRHLPVLRALPAHDRRAEHRVRPAHPRAQA
jgi:sulfate transport system substrate-binding protein